MNVVADSNFFIALSSKNDDLHSKAEAFAKLIQKRKDRVYINDLIFSEIVTVISQRVNQELARQVGDRLLTQRNSIYTVPITDILLQKTWNIFHQVQYKNVSLTDCSLLVLKDEVEAEAILTFDLNDFNKLQRAFRFHYYE